MFGVYSYDHGSKLAGDYINDFNGVRQALKDVHTKLAGKTITGAKSYQGGALKIMLSDGSSVEF